MMDIGERTHPCSCHFFEVAREWFIGLADGRTETESSVAECRCRSSQTDCGCHAVKESMNRYEAYEGNVFTVCRGTLGAGFDEAICNGLKPARSEGSRGAS